jgi:hypothetical protein
MLFELRFPNDFWSLLNYYNGSFSSLRFSSSLFQAHKSLCPATMLHLALPTIEVFQLPDIIYTSLTINTVGLYHTNNKNTLVFFLLISCSKNISTETKFI